jgi:hypothetical protein
LLPVKSLSAREPDFATCFIGAERRRKPRIAGPFPAIVYGLDSSGEPFEVRTVVDNLSSCGLYVRLSTPLEPGAALSITVCLTTTGSADTRCSRVALHGIVLRSELKHDGTCGVAVSVTGHRFIYTN